MDLNRLKIATKLWIFIGLIMVLLVSIAGIGLVHNANILAQGRAQQLVAEQLVQVATRWNGLTQANAVRTHATILSSDLAVADAFKNAVTATSNEISELQKQLEALPLTAQDKTQMDRIAELRKTVIALRDAARAAKAQGKQDDAMNILQSRYLPAMASYVDAQKELVILQERRVIDVQADTERRRQTNTMVILLGLLTVVAFVIVGTTWLVRSIRDPLNQANELAFRITQGDLRSHIHTERQDEFGTLLRSLAAMNESLSRMVAQVRMSTDNIATASAEIASGNNDLALRTEQTSCDLQSTASTMDALTATVQHSTDNSLQASALAASASNVAQRGGEVVTQVVSTMQEIDVSSKKIADIIGVIDGIAFQTNILALNAAVEAARAGEQGRGFAVVASEVRSLAKRSAAAAKEIKLLIDTSVQKVESGTRLVSDAGATMGDIVQSVRRVADVIGEITCAAGTQGSGIAGVNAAIGSLDQMTQQNAALVEQSAAASQSLREQVDHMKQAVSVFQMPDPHPAAL